MPHFEPDDTQVARFRDDGYLVVESLLDPEETDLLRAVAKADHALERQAVARKDASGAVVKLTVRNELADDEADLYAAIVRARRVALAMERFLDDEVYHYHHKMILKEARVGAAWEWHQDYGYWYDNGCLFPDMGSCLIAVDPATRSNGCLQVLPSSHRMGRINHGPVGDQTGADPERVAAALERLERVYVELEPGSAVFFHANTLHRSDPNTSPDPRWAFIACYNTLHNDPYKESRHPRYTPLEVWPDERLKQAGRRHLDALRAAAG